MEDAVTEFLRSATSWTYLEADEIAESGLARLNSHLRVRIRTWGGSHTHEAIREIEPPRVLRRAPDLSHASAA